MKKILYFLLFLSTQGLAQNKIVGYVKLQNSGKSPLANVEVYSLGAQTTYTNEKGYFELQFANKKVGGLVASVEFSLEGYSVLNEERCQGLNLPKDPTLNPLMVVMSNKRDFRARKAEYYDVIYNNAKQNFEAERKKLQAQIDQLATNDEERRILLSKIAELEEEKQGLLERAEKLAEQFAEINLDAASQLTKDALALFKDGKVKAAIASLDDELLDQNMREAQQNKVNAQEKLMQADSAIQQGVENYMVKARLQKADLQWEAAKISYEKAILGDSVNVDNLFEIGNYIYYQNDQKKAIQYYEQALRHENNEGKEAGLLNNIGLAYQDGNNYARAKKYLQSALEIRERLARENPTRFEADVAMSQNNLGVMYYDLNKYTQSEQYYLAALEIKERLARNNPAYFESDLASTQNNLGLMYLDMNQYAKAEQYYLAALEIYERLAKDNPANFEVDLASTQNNLGVMYDKINQYDKAEQSYIAALEIYEHLSKDNQTRFEPNVAMIQNNLGLLHKDINQYTKAKQYHLTALEIYERLAKDNPARFESNVAMSQNNLGFVYYDMKQYTETKQYYLAALEIYERLARENPARFESSVAMSQHNLGNLYKNIGQYTNSEQSYLVALEIRKRLANDNPERFEPDVAMTQNNLGIFYFQQGQSKKAFEMLDSSLPIYRKFAKQNPVAYDLEVARTLMIIGIIKQGSTEGNKVLLEAKTLAEKYPDLPFAQTVLDTFKQFYETNLNQTASNLLLEDISNYEQKVKESEAYTDKVQHQKTVVQLLDSLSFQNPNNKQITDYTANQYGSLAWFYLFTQEFEAAETAVRKALAMSEASEWANTNLAIALLFQGKYKEAEAIYLRLKNKEYGDATYRETFLKDLEDLEAAGVTHKDVKKVRKLLKGN